MFRLNRKWQGMALPLLFALIFSFAGQGIAEQWQLDKAHSSVDFTVTHFFTPVKGTFDKFDVKLNFDPDDLKNSSIEAEIQVSSINTRNEKRNSHLQSADFFNAEKYPVMTFKSDQIMEKGDGFVAKGTLQIKDVKKEIELPFELLGIKELPEDMQKQMGGLKKAAGFHATYTLDRNDYSVGTGSWAATVIVGDEVNIDISIEAHIR